VQVVPTDRVPVEVDVAALVERTVKVQAACASGSGWGSGVVLEGDYNRTVIATAELVVDGTGCFFTAVRHDGSVWPVFSVALDEKHDVAVLTTRLGWDSPRVELAEGVLGAPVINVGYPSDKLKGRAVLTVTRGTLAAVYDLDDDEGYRVTAQIMPGSSGGPCWTPDGRLIGLTVSAMMAAGIPYDGHYYVTRAEHVFALANLGEPAPEPDMPQLE
jgi:S1-C subfamily serine protease